MRAKRLLRFTILLPTGLCLLMPGPGAQAQPREGASAASHLVAQSGASASELFNVWIDNLLAAAERLLHLPLYVLLAAAAFAILLLTAIAARFVRERARGFVWRAMGLGLGLIAVLALALLADRRLMQLRYEIQDLRLRTVPATAPPTTAPAVSRLLFDASAAQRQLERMFSEVHLEIATIDQTTDFIRVRIARPLVSACVAVVDLTSPVLELKLSSEIGRKWLTSEFARKNNCTVAINGEAGMSPGMDAPLGVWRGYLMHRGELILSEEAGNPRPFISFDRQNRASFVAAASRDRALPADSYNVIWGRFDAIIEGEVQTANLRNRQPRTVMGVNREGTRLYLAVIDGRQPGHSMGMTLAEAGSLLKSFGAHNAMLCDEGGSSCMYLAAGGGIVNIPSDRQGEERPTYTHFGIGLRDGI